MDEVLHPIVELILNQILSIVLLAASSYLFIKGIIVPAAVYEKLTESIVTKLAEKLEDTFQKVLDAQCGQCRAQELANQYDDGELDQQ